MQLKNIANYRWYILRQLGDKYFLLAENPLFMGYYSLKDSDYNNSKVNNYLTTKFLEQISRSGVDVKNITNLGILTAGQYEIYVKTKLPPTTIPYMTQTPSDQNSTEKIYAVGSDGELFECDIRAQCGIRPCMFIDKEYADSIAETIYRDDYVSPNTNSNPEGEELMDQKDKTEELSTSDAQSSENNPLYNQTLGSKTDEVLEESASVEDGSSDESSSSSELSHESIDEREWVDEGVVSTPDGTVIPVKVNFGVHAAYLYTEEEFKRYAILYAGGEEEMREIMEQYGIVVSEFVSHSVVVNRGVVTRDDVIKHIDRQAEKWRWRKD